MGVTQFLLLTSKIEFSGIKAHLFKAHITVEEFTFSCYDAVVKTTQITLILNLLMRQFY